MNDIDNSMIISYNPSKKTVIWLLIPDFDFCSNFNKEDLQLIKTQIHLDTFKQIPDIEGFTIHNKRCWVKTAEFKIF
jgi:hypothetical protein